MLTREERFQNWRGEALATKEQAFLDTALKLDSLKSLSDLKHDFKSTATLAHKQYPALKNLIFSVILHLIFNTEEFQHSLSQSSPIFQGEDAFTALNQILKEFYASFITSCKHNLDRLIILSDFFLRYNFQNTEATNSFYYAFYTLIATLSIYFDNLGNWTTVVKTLTGKTPEFLQKEIQKLQNLAENNIVNFERSSQPRISIYSLFLERNLSILENPNIDFPRQLVEEKNILNDLIRLKNDETKININIAEINQLQTSLDEGKPFIDSIFENVLSYNAIINNIQGEEEFNLKSQLLAAKEKIKPSGMMQNTFNSMKSGLNFVLKKIPSGTQPLIDSLLETPEDTCRATLKKLIIPHIERLNRQLATINVEKTTLITELAKGDDFFKNRLMQQNNNELEHLLLCQNKANEGLLLLSYLNQAIAKLSEYITKNYGFWVRLSLFLAIKVNTGFLTATAKSIINAQSSLDEITGFNEYCTNVMKKNTLEANFITKCKQSLEKMPTIPNTPLNTTTLFQMTAGWKKSISPFYLPTPKEVNPAWEYHPGPPPGGAYFETKSEHNTEAKYLPLTPSGVTVR